MKILAARPICLLALAVLLAACERSADDVVIVEREVVVDAPAPEVVETVETPAPTVTVDVQPGSPAPAATAAPVAAPAAEKPTSLAYLTGDVEPANDPGFKRIPEKFVGGARVWGNTEAVDALVRMGEAAAADGITLKAVSAFRSFRDQKRIWEDKWGGRTHVEGGKLPETHPDPAARAVKILEFSSMPATSRHHWGTDFDFNNLNNSYFASGKGKAEYDWLVANAGRFGFCQVYSPKGADRPTGYEEEKWHWSYLPVASVYLEQYPAVVGYGHITGFQGADAARSIDVIANYVQGINPACK